MDLPIDQQIADALIELVSTTGEEDQYPDEAHLLSEHRERFYELYKTNGLIASLTHRVLMNRVVAHYFVVVLRDLRELWLEEEELRVFSPVAYPFSIQQYRHYVERVFRYSIVLGWPGGLPVIQFPMLDDQSEFIHGQAYYSGLILGLLGLGLVLGVVVMLNLVDKYGNPPQASRLKPDYLVLIPLQLALVLLMGQLWLWGGFIYLVGGFGVLVVSSIPIVLAKARNRLMQQTDQEDGVQ